MQPQTFIFIGRSGCGKGTQADLLIKFLKEKDTENRKVFYLESGARFREFISGKTFSSKLSNEIYAQNKRQPDFLAIWNWSHLLVDSFTGEEHLVIDGTPRSIAEAKILDTAMDFYKRIKPYIVYINVNRDWSESHLRERGRKDDSGDGIKRRLDWFEKDVLPAIDFYRGREDYVFIEVDGEQTIDKVHSDIIEKIQLK